MVAGLEKLEKVSRTYCSLMKTLVKKVANCYCDGTVAESRKRKLNLTAELCLYLREIFSPFKDKKRDNTNFADWPHITT